MRNHKYVGIEAIAVHIPYHFVDLRNLALANNVDPAKYYLGLGGRRMAVASPGEDPVTMAVEASRALVKHYLIEPATIGLVIVGTESGVDGAKPIASYVHGLLKLSGDCRTFDIKHACYSGTAAIRMAADWCAAGSPGQGRKALVIATDIARYSIGSAGEPTQGAGAVATLIGNEPAIMALDPYPEAVFTEEVMDFWRPHYRLEAVVNGRTSIDCYLKALEYTYAAYEKSSGLRLDDYEYLLFHVPFPKMAHKAFKLLYEREKARRKNDGNGFLPLEEAFELRTRPALWANQELGNIYSGSLYLSLAGLLEKWDINVQGARVGLFSYGSGSCSEFFSGQIGSNADAWRGKIGIARGLTRRVELAYDQYLSFCRASEVMSQEGSYTKDLLNSTNRGDGNLTFCGVRNHKRVYTFSSGNEVSRDSHPRDEDSSCFPSWKPFPARENSAKAQMGK